MYCTSERHLGLAGGARCSFPGAIAIDEMREGRTTVRSESTHSEGGRPRLDAMNCSSPAWAPDSARSQLGPVSGRAAIEHSRSLAGSDSRRAGKSLSWRRRRGAPCNRRTNDRRSVRSPASRRLIREAWVDGKSGIRGRGVAECCNSADRAVPYERAGHSEDPTTRKGIG